jgi:hypothetical protein
LTEPVLRYRKRPVEVEAMQWDGTAAGAGPIIDWILANGPRAARYNDNPALGQPGICINTLEGTMTATPGDWIIRGVQDEFYPCKPDIFEATYAPVTTQQDPGPGMLEAREVDFGPPHGVQPDQRDLHVGGSKVGRAWVPALVSTRPESEWHWVCAVGDGPGSVVTQADSLDVALAGAQTMLDMQNGRTRS